MMIPAKILLFVIFLLLAAASILFSLFKGSTLISFGQLFHAAYHSNDRITEKIILDIRLPRTLAAFITGGSLSLAGAMMQVLLRNPLADPYILGISGGGAFLCLLCMLCGFTGYWLTFGTWIGSLLAVFIVFFLAHRKNAQPHNSLLLTGIAIGSGFSAFISFILMMSPETELHSMLFWLLGDLSYAHLPFIESGILCIGLIMSILWGKQFNILMRGELSAKALGISTERLKIKIYFLSALLTASAVSLAGCIGFVGLIVPHLFRLLFGSDHRILLPGTVLLGGSLLTIADTLARTAFAPEQLPVGIIMVFIGVPIFLILLQRSCRY